MIEKIKENFDEIFDMLGTMLVALIIVVLNIIIGANEKPFRVFPLGMCMILMIVYLLTKKVKYKGKIAIKSKVDIVVFLFMMSTALPLIFGTYCSWQGNMEFILKYFFVYTFYLLIRNVIDTSEKATSITIITICASLIPIIFGIDELYFGYFAQILQIFDLDYTKSARLSAPFGYSNTAATYMAFCIFLAINMIQNNKGKTIKIFMSVYIILAGMTLYLTNSRAVFALFAFGIFTYFILMYKLNSAAKSKKMLSKVFLGLTIVVILGAIYCVIGLNYSSPYYVKGDVDSGTIREKLNANQEYEFKIDMECEDETDAQIQIAIVENNQYLFRKKIAVQEVTDFSQIQTIKFTPTEEVLTIEYRIYNYSGEKIKVNKFYLDGREYIMNYKYIPNSIGRLMRSFSLKELSVKQRLDFYKDSLKIAKEHPLIGQGGNTWKVKHRSVQDYDYHVKETHSYFFELLICYGILGTALYVALVICVNVKMIKMCFKDKETAKQKLALWIGLDVMILHSLVFDFDMSYVLILLTVFGFIAMLMQGTDEEKNRNKYVDGFVFVLLTCIGFIYACGIIGKYYAKDEKMKYKIAFYNTDLKYSAIYEISRKSGDFKSVLDDIQELIEKEPYYRQTVVYNLYCDTLSENKEKMSDEEIADYAAWIIQRFETIEFVTPMNVNEIMLRVEVMERLMKTLESINSVNFDIRNNISLLKNIMKAEYEKNILNITDISRNGETEEKVQRLQKDYEFIIKSIENK